VPVFSVPFSALTLLVEWLERHPACEKPAPIIDRGYLFEDPDRPGEAPEKKAKT